jgi:hypothetical protein
MRLRVMVKFVRYDTKVARKLQNEDGPAPANTQEGRQLYPAIM